MRYLGPLLLLAAPLAGQRVPVAPAPSRLFAQEAPSSIDTVPAELASARIRGGRTGAVVGGVTGAALAVGLWAIGDHGTA